MKLHHEYDYGEDCIIGRDPREMTADELAAAGKPPISLLAAIRENCIGCCAGSPGEVRRCAIIDCSLWPFRMGTNPFRAMNAEQKVANASKLAKGRASKAAKTASAQLTA